MIGIGPLAAFLAGSLAVAIASAVVVASVVERPPMTQASRVAVVVAGAWAVAFVVATVLDALGGGSLAIAGMLFAAGELAAAAAIWFLRSRRRRRGWGRGWDDDPDDGPPEGGLPEEYWRFWETDLARRPLSR